MSQIVETGSFYGDRTAGSFSFATIVLALRNGYRTVCGALLCCWLAAAVVIALTPVSYIASTQVMLEPLPRKPMTVALDGVADPLDSAQADSRMQVVKSERLLRFVFNTLGWPRGAVSSTINPGAQAIGWVKNLVWPSSPDQDETVHTRALLDFMDRVGVKRLGLSYVIEISFQAKDPETATFMANAITAAYLRNLVKASPLDDELLQRRFANIEIEEAALLDGMRRGVIPDQYFPDANARVISAAIRPLTKATPKSSLIAAMATLLGLSAGFVLSISRHQKDRSVRTGEETFIPKGLRLLGRFPAGWKLPSEKATSRHGGRDSFPHLRPSSPLLLAETNDKLGARRYRVFGFVALRSGMGTSSIALSIAEEAARCGLRTTLVDANLMTPSLSRLKASEMSPGLTDIARDRDHNSCIKPIDLGAFDFLSVGLRPEDPCLLSSLKVGAILKELSKRGPVFLDLPALDTSLEAQSMARHMDAIVLVASAKDTQVEELSKYADQLYGKVIGFVLNRVNFERPAAHRQLAATWIREKISVLRRFGSRFGRKSSLASPKQIAARLTRG